MKIKKISLVSGYFIAIASPLVLAFYLHPTSEEGFIANAGMLMGMAGIMMVFFQFIISARIKWLDRLYAYNNLIDFHKRMGVLASFFIIVHFLLLTLSEQSLDMLFGISEPWYVNLGKAAFLLLLVQILISINHRKIKMRYEQWRSIHDLLALSLLVLMFVHSFFAGGDLELYPLQILWFVLPPVAIAFFIWQRFFQFTFAPNYKVVDVIKKTNNTFNVQFAPENGDEVYAYNPGQFHFIKFSNCKYLADEEHPFTISSSPCKKSYISSTIKSSGDFTRQIHQLQKGDKVKIIGPFGKMSFVEKPHAGSIVFIAGGIGITPFMSMLQYMSDMNHKREVVLFYFNPTEADIAFREELEQLISRTSLHLKVVHILSKQDNWEGEKGRFNTTLLERHCLQSILSTEYYVCGPSLMSQAVIADLNELGVPLNKIHSEMFGLAGSGSPKTHQKKQAQSIARYVAILLLLIITLFAGIRSDWKLFDDKPMENGHSQELLKAD